MRSSVVSALLSAASLAAAIQITSPAKNDVVDLSSGVEVKWTTVSTDPSTAHLFLVNMASGHTPFSKDLGEVDLSTGSLLVTEKDAPEEEAFQFNFQSVNQNNMGILAQSEQFENKKSDDKDDDDLVTTTTKAITTTGTAKTTLTTTTTAATASTTTGAGATDGQTNDGNNTTESTAGTASGTASGAAASSTQTPGSGAAGVTVKGGMLALVVGVLAVVA